MMPLPLWFTTKNALKALPYILAVFLVCYGLHSLYETIYDRGAASVQAKWDAQEKKRKDEILMLQGEILHKQAIYQEETQKLNHKLANAQRDYEKALDDITADYHEWLRLSEKRTAIYRHQAESGPIECGNLASHASRLDATLEEGRSLVAELRTTLEFRDHQVKGLGDQIVSDRKLFE